MGNIKSNRFPEHTRSQIVKVYFLDQIRGKAAVGGRRAGGAAVEDESLRVITFSNAFSDALLTCVMRCEKFRFKFGGSA
jgi:hypothetical protein